DRSLGGAHELADAPDLLVDEVARGPSGRAATDFEQEVMEDLTAARRVGHFRMEQHAVDGLGLVLHRRHRGVRAGGRHAEVRRRGVDPVAVTRPYGDAAVWLEAGEQTGRFADCDL